MAEHGLERFPDLTAARAVIPLEAVDHRRTRLVRLDVDVVMRKSEMAHRDVAGRHRPKRCARFPALPRRPALPQPLRSPIEISDRREMVSLMSLMAATDSSVAAWMPPICRPISPVASTVCSARAFTSDAATAKPRPASPARAAPIVTLSASRFICPAIELINSTTSPMRPAALTIG
jgi:hypothetical protein